MFSFDFLCFGAPAPVNIYNNFLKPGTGIAVPNHRAFMSPLFAPAWPAPFALFVTVYHESQVGAEGDEVRVSRQVKEELVEDGA